MAEKVVKHIKSIANLPDWFPLEIYKNTLAPEDWVRELGMRAVIKQSYELQTYPVEEIRTHFLKLFVKDQDSERWIEPQRAPVRGIPAFDVIYLATLLERHPSLTSAKDIARRLTTRKCPGPLVYDIPDTKSALSELEESESKYLWHILSGLPVTVNLDLDDETLIAWFRVLLQQWRHTTGARAPKPLGQKDFEDWKKYGVLPVFDLDMWARLEEVRIADRVIARAVWPEDTDDIDNFDPIERLRKVTRIKRIPQAISWATVNRLSTQYGIAKMLKQAMEEVEQEGS